MSARRDRLLWEAAAGWYARMQEPRSKREVAAFESWLADDPAHARAYAEMEALSGAAAAVGARSRERAYAATWSGWRPALAAAALVAIVVTTVLAWGGFSDPAYARVSNTGESVRGVRLADGTEVWLDVDAVLLVSNDERRRTIVLRQGRVRVSPVSGSTALRVLAADLSVMPSSNRFDLAIEDRTVELGALDGPITLSSGGGRTLSLTAGRGIAVDENGVRPVPLDRTWPGARLRFTDTPLGRIVAIANRQPGPDIVFADPAIGKLTVTGVLDLRDTRRLARKLAAAQDLRLVEDSGRLMLQR